MAGLIERAVLPLEIQQGAMLRRLMHIQRLHLSYDNHVIPRLILGVNFAIQPVQAAANQRIAQGRGLPVDALPFVCAALCELIGNRCLLIGQDVDGKATSLADFRVVR